MEPVGVRRHIGEELLFHLSAAEVAPDEFAALAPLQRAGVPDEAAADDEILGRAIARFLVRRFPQELAGGRIESAHRAVAAREKHRLARKEQARPEIVFVKLSARGPLTDPDFLPTLRVKAMDLFPVVVDEACSVDRGRERSDEPLQLPKCSSFVRIQSHEDTRLLVPFVFLGDALLIALLLRCKILEHPFRRGIDEGVENAVGIKELLRPLRLGKHMQFFPGRSVEHGDGCGDAHRHENPLAVRDEAARQRGRPRLQRPEVRAPLLDRLLPENRSVEGVAGDEVELRGQEDADARTLVHDVEKTSLRRDLRAEGRHAVVVARPARTAEPLEPFRGTDLAVLRGGVALRVVIVVRPLVHR